MMTKAVENKVAPPNTRRTDKTKVRLGLALVVGCALAALFWPKGDGTVPPGMLIDSGGQVVTLGSRMAPVTLVHFWATWCAPCITEVPSIQRLAEEFETGHSFSLLMIAVADDPDKVSTFLGEGNHRSLFDHDWKVARRYKTFKVPETHLVVEGKVVERFIGAQDWDDPAIRGKVAEALLSLEES